LCALLAARERVTQSAANEVGCRGDLVVYGSRETHSSLDKAVMIAGIGRRNLRKIAVDSVNGMDPTVLAAQIATDRAAGLTPTMVCATLGTTSTLAFDPLPQIAEICQREGIWLHVDAALAGSAAVCPEYQYLLRGLESVDSYCFNPHKWLLTNFDCTCFFVSDRAALINALAINPSYLNNAATAAGTVIDYRDWQIPLGRRFRALKLWFVLRRFGVARLQEHIRRHIELTAQFAAMVADDLRFEIVAPVTLNLVCFRYRGANEINERVLEILNTSGKIFISHTMLNEQFVLRFCVGQPRTERKHVQSAWHEIQSALTQCLI
jgi:aromatic-L-amino-acid decarboxylase